MKEIYALIEKFEGSSLTELSIERNDTKFRIKRETKKEYMQEVSRNEVLLKQIDQEEILEDSNLICIKSPLVGTFYRSSTPEEKPYAMVGQKVKKGEVLGLIEAMKLMNEVIAPMDGTIEEILAENDELVQFDEVIIKMKEFDHV
jgi:acetyl-CoA carboxylase biotin carboxyl carrier protein